MSGQGGGRDAWVMALHMVVGFLAIQNYDLNTLFLQQQITSLLVVYTLTYKTWMHYSFHPVPESHYWDGGLIVVCSAPGLCLPSAVKESHPRCATPGHRWWMEPKGRAAISIGPSLVAIITVMMRADKNRHGYSIRNQKTNAERTLITQTSLRLCLEKFSSQMRHNLLQVWHIQIKQLMLLRDRSIRKIAYPEVIQQISCLNSDTSFYMSCMLFYSNCSAPLWCFWNCKLFVLQIKWQSSAMSPKWSGQIAPISATCTQMQKCCDCKWKLLGLVIYGFHGVYSRSCLTQETCRLGTKAWEKKRRNSNTLDDSKRGGCGTHILSNIKIHQNNMQSCGITFVLLNTLSFKLWAVTHI